MFTKNGNEKRVNLRIDVPDDETLNKDPSSKIFDLNVCVVGKNNGEWKHIGSLELWEKLKKQQTVMLEIDYFNPHSFLEFY